MVYFIYALNRIGATACLVDPRTNAEGILQRVNESNSKILVALTDIFSTKIALIYKQLTVKTIVEVSPSDSTTWETFASIAVKLMYCMKRTRLELANCVKFKKFIDRADCFSEEMEATFQENKPAIVVYTSGSTGSPKGVLISNENMVAAKKMLENDTSDVSANAAFLGAIPFFSAYGAVNGMHNSLACGWKIVLIPKYKPCDFGKLLLKHKASCALGVPRFWSDFAKNNNKANLSFLKKPICGGDKISPTSIDEINDYLLKNGGSRLIIGYGSSEFGGAIAVTTANGPYKKEGTGELLPGVIGMAVDPNTDEELEYGCNGELCFHSPTMMLGYLNHENETQQITVYKNGIKFYRTGDKGHISETGTLYVVDRYKRIMIRPDGHTVHATPIENTIMLHPYVEICAVVGISFDANAGTIPTAFIVLRNGEYEAGFLVDEIDALCTDNIPERDKAHIYVLVDKLPYTLMGKIDYRVLEKMNIEALTYVVKDNTFVNKKVLLGR